MKFETDRIHEAKQETFNELRKEGSLKGDENGNVEVMDERFNIMGADYFMADILDMLMDVYGDGAAGILDLGGKGYAEDLLEFLDAEDPDRKLGEFFGLLKFLGYSDITVENEKIHVSSSPTAEEYVKSGREGEKTCHFMSGMFEAAIHELYEESPVVREEKCMAEGHDSCSFEVVTGN